MFCCVEVAGDGCRVMDTVSCLDCGRVEWPELCCGIQCMWSEERIEGPREGESMEGGRGTFNL